MINVIFNDLKCEILPKQLETYEKYCKILQWGRQHPTRFLEDFVGLMFTDHQKYVILSSWVPANVVWLCSRASGKAEALDTKVYPLVRDREKRGDTIYRFPKTIGELQVGDIIYDADGLPTEVIHLNPIILEEGYEVEFEDGEKIICNAEHLWKVWDRNFDKNNKYNGDKWVLRTTDFIYNNFQRSSKENINDYRFRVPITKPIKYPNIKNKIRIDPYLLGVWLGDGAKNAPSISCGEQDLENMIENLTPLVKTIKYEKQADSNCYRIHLDRLQELLESNNNRKVQQKESLLQKLRNLNVYNNKHIPLVYKQTSIENRFALLQGLMDTDGTIDKTGHCEFIQTNKILFDDFCELLDGLGIQYSVIYKQHTGYIKKDKTEADTWRCYFVPPNNQKIFRLKRKYERQRNDIVIGIGKKAIVNVRKTNKKVPMRCITVSNQSGLFLCGEHCTVTHNSFMSAPFIMGRSLLFPNHNTYIMGPSGGQAIETMGKLENLAKGNIASVLGVSSFFLDECVRQNAKADPFTHDKSGHHVALYNGSTINTLNSVAKNIVGIRLNLVVLRRICIIYILFNYKNIN